MGKPARPYLVFGSIDEMCADVARLRAGPVEQAGQWDLPMILDHLTKAMNTFTTEQKQVPWPADIVLR